jgi:hypothetical protein
MVTSGVAGVGGVGGMDRADSKEIGEEAADMTETWEESARVYVCA